jgi:uncharacterized membrane protein
VGHRDINVLIAAPPGAVYDLWADPARITEWQPDVQGVAVEGPIVPGSRWVISYGRLFKVRVELVGAERPTTHVVSAREMAGLVTCRTTAHFEPTGDGTRIDVDFDYTVRGGPLGRVFDDMVGREMVTRFEKDAARLKVVAERR